MTYVWIIEEGSTTPPDEFARPGNGRGGRETGGLDDGGGDGNSITAGEFVPVNTDYIWSAGPGAYIDSMIARINNQHGTLYVQHDANFNVTALLETDGDVVERFVYDAYGSTTYLNPDWTTDTSGTDYKWVYLNQGLRHEGASNTDDARNRVVLPALGRPAQPDPIGYPDGMNRSEWEGSNPVRWVDPSGLTSDSPFLPDPGQRPPGWNPDWPTGSDKRGPFSQDPATGEKWYPHKEGKGHWPHYDDGAGKRRFPKKCIKPWPTQTRRPYGDQSPTNPWPAVPPASGWLPGYSGLAAGTGQLTGTGTLAGGLVFGGLGLAGGAALGYCIYKWNPGNYGDKVAPDWNTGDSRLPFDQPGIWMTGRIPGMGRPPEAPRRPSHGAAPRG